MKLNFTSLLTMGILSFLCVGCATQSPPEPTKPVVNVQPSYPSATIVGRSNKTIMEDIIRYRSSKGMKIRSRSANQIEFMSAVTKANIPTEARIQYSLMQTPQGWKLTARVYQISYPSSKNEKVEDITLSVADKLNEELARYVTN
ncbi:hypothetical protein HQ393_01540 [Chitinibacter bivalviorum]|uniref:Lipoprotein n=1 Tax=Chitinibacter bivalviorum TaxID=2739434 RepID=A0A7H9BEI1_9NEIS|nr:hypothetical protein [Chitinibacter bivalviorum]QLG87029.1 hypothetical protein HQ393_01540 [Chitinibacter bivalviorum]